MSKGKWNEPRIDRGHAHSLISQGMKNIVIAKLLGCGTSTVVKIKRELGFEVKGFRKGLGETRTAAERKRLEAKYANTPKPPRGRALYAPSDLKKATAAENDLFAAAMSAVPTKRPSDIQKAAAQKAPNPRGNIVRHPNGFTGFPSLKQGASVAAISGAAEADARRRAFAASPAEKTQLTDNKNREPVPLFPVLDTDSGALREHAVAFADLRADGCKWATTPHDAPTHGHRFCNAPRTSHVPYCGMHLDKARGVTVRPLDGLSGIDLSAARMATRAA